MDKRLVLEAVIAALRAELEGYARSARSAQAEATDEQSKAENKYDTRGLEASYLARGQSRQAAETAQSLQLLQALTADARSTVADVGALVEVEHAGEVQLYFMGPAGGGTEVMVEGRAVIVITPQSPLGQQLAGKRAGARIALPGRGKKAKAYRIVSVG